MISHSPIREVTRLVLAILVASGTALATPSTQIWIPSTDVQKWKSVHLNMDTYVRTGVEPGGSRLPPLVVIGPTIGVSPWDAMQVELGFDAMFQGNARLDGHPLYFHGKVATPESKMFRWSPALAIGIYNVGYQADLTNQDIGYLLLARTLPILGRISVGYYYGNRDVLVDAHGKAANQGLLASWDRTLSEVSDRLWLAVDYQGGASALSSVNFGLAWAFSTNVSVIVGYDLYLASTVAGRDTLSCQVDINI